MSANKQISFEGIQRFLRSVFGQDLHAKRILSLAGATLGAIESASLAVALIGQGLALARGLKTKYAIKQVDRMLANMAIDVDALLRHWVPFIVGKRPGITVAMDWTELNRRSGDAHAVDAHQPRTSNAAVLADRRYGDAEEPAQWPRIQALVRLAEALPDGVQVFIVADRASAIISCTAC